MSTCLAVAQDLIRLPSMNPPGDEAACIDYLAKRLESSGLAVETYEFAPGRPSLVARLSRPLKRAALVLYGTRRRRSSRRQALVAGAVWRRHRGRQALRPWKQRHEGRGRCFCRSSLRARTRKSRSRAHSCHNVR